MTTNRFVIERESGNDYCIFDTTRRITVASGLTYEEADQGIKNRELELEDQKRASGIVG